MGDFEIVKVLNDSSITSGKRQTVGGVILYVDACCGIIT